MALFLSVGYAVIVVVGALLTANNATAQLTVPVVVAGLGLSFP